jgi:hypothetical protein
VFLKTPTRLQALGYRYQHGSDTLLHGRSTVLWQVLEILGSFCKNTEDLYN